LEKALASRKPVYIEIPCNIAGAATSAPHARTFAGLAASDVDSLDNAVSHALEVLGGAVKPTLVGGVKLRSYGAEQAFADLAEASRYATATMPNAKGMYPENSAGYMGTYWGAVSTPGCSEIVESADIVLYAGATFTDYTTVGHSILLSERKSILAGPNAVVIAGESYSRVALADFLAALAQRVEPNDASRVAFDRVREERPAVVPGPADAPLTTRQLFARVQNMLGPDIAIVAETGDSWFNGMGLALPEGSHFEIQMQYGSIGWSVGATLGYALGDSSRRVVALIGDGSFQLTAQEVSTMIRTEVNPILFVINNGGYTIEVEIHDGPYNTIKNWHYAGLMKVFNAEDGQGWGTRATTEGELDVAIAKALQQSGPCLIEVVIDRDDCSKTLLEWGGHVAKNNGRPPRSS
jgi:TPP-dependent 2-oxoacid decarboxylase